MSVFINLTSNTYPRDLLHTCWGFRRFAKGKWFGPTVFKLIESIHLEGNFMGCRLYILSNNVDTYQSQPNIALQNLILFVL